MTVPAGEQARLEEILDTAGVGALIEPRLPVGVRPRQLSVRTLMLGMLLAARDGRPGHLTRVHQALLGLSEPEQRRLGVLAATKHGGEHRLTGRQTEYTFMRLTQALSRPIPDGTPSQLLCEVTDRLLEASIQILGPPASNSYAVDWTDLESWARPPSRDGSRPSADPEAAWGHRTTNHPSKNELFYGYYLQALTTVSDEHGPAVPELVRRIHLAACDHDPPAQITPVIARMHHAGIPVGDLLVDSGYSYRQPDTFALPLRQLGAQLIMDLHPNDRGPHGTHHGAITANGALYCPATPPSLLALGPLAPAATPEQTAAHDQQCAELHRHKLSPITTRDADGYHRVACPATTGKLRCPLRPASMTLSYDHPTIHQPPEHPPVCCTQQTITIPPSVNAKTTQKHDYPSAQHRHSYARRSAAERSFATSTDRGHTDLSRGHIRLTGLAPNTLITATALTARPQPPHPRRLRRPTGPKPAPRPTRPGTPPTQTPPTHHHRPDQRRRHPALTPRNRRAAPADDQHHPTSPPGTSTPPPRPPHHQPTPPMNRSPTGPPTANHARTPRANSIRRKREHETRSNVKTSKWS